MAYSPVNSVRTITRLVVLPAPDTAKKTCTHSTLVMLAYLWLRSDMRVEDDYEALKLQYKRNRIRLDKCWLFASQSDVMHDPVTMR